MSLSGLIIVSRASKDEFQESAGACMNASLVRGLKVDHVATSKTKLSLYKGRATITSTYIVEDLSDEALMADIAKMRLKRQS